MGSLSLCLVILFSILSLQLGFNYWISGATAGSVIFMLIIMRLCVGNFHINRIHLFSLIFAAILPIKLLADASSLRDFRILLFMMLYLIVFVLLNSFRLDTAAYFAVPVGISAAISILTLFISQILISASSVYSMLHIQLLDKWLVANQTFQGVDHAIVASKFKYFGLYDRFSLFYGEPSYLSVALFACTFTLVYFILFLYRMHFITGSKLYPLLNILLFSSIVIGIVLMVATGSLYGLVCSFFTGICIFLDRVKLLRVLPFKWFFLVLTVALTIATFVILSITSFDLSLFDLIFYRIGNILAGNDGSQNSRIYPIVLFFEHPFGLGEAAAEIASSKYSLVSIDNGIVSNLVTYGLLFVVFLLSIACLLASQGLSFLPYYFYVMLVWMQSGNIFSPDKFLLSLLPLPVVYAYSRVSSMPSTRSKFCRL